MIAIFDGLTLRGLLLWERPHATGTIVGSLVTVLFIFGYMQYSWLTFMCRLVQVALVGCAFHSRMSADKIDANDIVRVASKALDQLHPVMLKAVEVLARVITWEDAALSTKVLGASILVAMVGNLLSDMALLFFFTVASFVAPAVYKQNQEVIDKQFAQLWKSGDELMKKIPASSEIKAKKEE